MRVACLCALFAAGLLPAAEQTITLDGQSPGRVFEGLGAVSAGASSRLLIDYPEPQRSEILDYLFKPGYGAALQHLKVEIGADVNSTDGSEPSHMRSPSDHDYARGYEWWLMKEARRRNPAIILDTLAWGAPGWIGGGKYYSADMAHYVADFLRGARDIHHLDIQYTGVWNERPYNAAWVKLLHRVLLAAGLPVKIVCCDDYHGKTQFEIIAAMAHDSELAEAVAAVGVHYPRDNSIDKYTTTEAVRASGRMVWSSEDQPNGGGGPMSPRDWPYGGRALAQIYNRNYLQGAFTKTEIWSPITAYFENLAAPHSGLMYANTPWSGNYEVQSTIWVTAHTTQFAQPGWRYLDRSSGFLPESAGTYVALKAARGNDWSLILETIQAKKPQAVAFKISGGLAAGTVHIWRTDAKAAFVNADAVDPRDGVFRYTFEPGALYSLTTTTGQGKGRAAPPPPKPFPAAYSENFEKTGLNGPARFLADQDGAFEAHACRERKGRCLEQVITQKPIPWGPLPNPFTLTGDSTWQDYRVQADVLPPPSGMAAILGRIDSADAFREDQATWPSGYIFQIAPDGKWQLLSSAYKTATKTLASGTAAGTGGWRRLALEFEGERIRAFVGSRQVAALNDGSHRSGMFALGTGWERAQFDNLEATLRERRAASR